MPVIDNNNLSATGLTVNSTTDIVSNLTLAFQGIYGNQINVDANSPDGQLINILAQVIEDNLQLLVQVFNSFSVNNSFGHILDQRVALNGIKRNQGTSSVVYASVTTNRAVALPGLDVMLSDPTATVFTVADIAGNQYQLRQSFSFGAAGTVSLAFVAVNIGPLNPTPNTITTVFTFFVGVVSVNNPFTQIVTFGAVITGQPQVTGIASTAGMIPGMSINFFNQPAGTFIQSVDSTSQITMSQNSATTANPIQIFVQTVANLTGLTEETDPQLKIRRVNSFFLPAVAPADAIRASLFDIPVTDAFVAENDTGSASLGVPAYGIWIIVNPGSATPSQIGTTIYRKKNPGCAMAGTQFFTVARPGGNTFNAQWDNAIPEDLYITATLFPRIPGQSFDVVADGIALAKALVYKLGQSPNVGDIAIAMAAIEPLAIVTSALVAGPSLVYQQIVSPQDFQHFFQATSARITLTNA